MLNQITDHLKKRWEVDELELKPVPGGDINRAFRATTKRGRYFVKFNDADFSKHMFQAETKGLEILASKAKIKVPRPLDQMDKEFGSLLVMDWIEQSRASIESWENFGRDLAKLHQCTHAYFGLDHHNFIGKLDQRNNRSSSWLEFYYNERIEPQMMMAIDDALIPIEYQAKVDKLFKLMEREIPKEKPSLLHGDLWTGNLIFDKDAYPVFIDPAVYYGNREMDIAMMRLFGGFDRGCSTYQEIYPLKENWMDRTKFYQLYYILVHVNLFQGHYGQSARQIIDFYTVDTSN